MEKGMKMIEKITEFLMKRAERLGKVLKITGTAGPDDVYLIRYYVVRSKYFNFFIHQFLRSDRDDLHDHPWDFMTYLVRGRYIERKWNPKLNKVEITVRESNESMTSFNEAGKRKTNRLVFRKATDQHQVLVNEDLKEFCKHLAPLTICITGPVRREWGFIKERDPFEVLKETDVVEFNGKVREWVNWKKYLGLPEDTQGRG